MYMYTHIYIYTHPHTHTYSCIYIYICVCVCIGIGIVRTDRSRKFYNWLRLLFYNVAFQTKDGLFTSCTYLCYHYEKRHQVDTGTLAFFRGICYLENDGGNKTRRVGKNGMRFRKEILIDLAHVDRSSLYVYLYVCPHT